MRLLILLTADCQLVAPKQVRMHILRSDTRSCKQQATCCRRLQLAQMSVDLRTAVRKRMSTSASYALTTIVWSCFLTVATL